jgi:hypothetical protein
MDGSSLYSDRKFLAPIVNGYFVVGTESERICCFFFFFFFFFEWLNIIKFSTILDAPILWNS